MYLCRSLNLISELVSSNIRLKAKKIAVLFCLRVSIQYVAWCCHMFLSLWFASQQTSAFEGSVFTHSDVKPGMVVKAKVIIVDSFGAIVQFPSGVKALCPLRHMSEFEISKPRKKFQVILSEYVYFLLVVCSAS